MRKRFSEFNCVTRAARGVVRFLFFFFVGWNAGGDVSGNWRLVMCVVCDGEGRFEWDYGRVFILLCIVDVWV